MGLQTVVIAGVGRQVCVEQAEQVLEYGNLGDRNLPGDGLLCLVYAGSEREVSPIPKGLIVCRRAYPYCSRQRVSVAAGGHE